MFSEHVQAKFPLRRVALFGGGRWSRVLLPVIHTMLGADSEIVWVTTNGYQSALQWLVDKGIDRVLVQSSVDLEVDKWDAAIVATSPGQHGPQVRKLLAHSIPTFCEKPFTLNFAEAVELQQMAARLGCPVGVNLEMHFASYLEDFANLLHGSSDSSGNLSEIEVTWLDPWSESRYGETKHGDVYTSIVDDMWPHCWSVLRRLCPHGEVQSVVDVKYESVSGQVDITVRFAEVLAKVALGRRSDRRVRRVAVKNGGESVLDFSEEPGSTEIDGVLSKNEWRGERPLSRSLKSFFAAVLNADRNDKWADDWELSALACLDSVSSAEKISGALRTLQQAIFSGLSDSGIELADPSHRNLIIDLLLPEFSAKDRRWPVLNMEEQIAFTRHVCETQGLRCR